MNQPSVQSLGWWSICAVPYSVGVVFREREKGGGARKSRSCVALLPFPTNEEENAPENEEMAATTHCRQQPTCFSFVFKLPFSSCFFPPFVVTGLTLGDIFGFLQDGVDVHAPCFGEWAHLSAAAAAVVKIYCELQLINKASTSRLWFGFPPWSFLIQFELASLISVAIWWKSLVFHGHRFSSLRVCIATVLWTRPPHNVLSRHYSRNFSLFFFLMHAK